MPKVLDLYSGLGGFSEAFVQDPNYEVIRIENNPLLAEVPHTLLGDILKMNPQDPLFQGADLILASPPCNEFSLAYGGPRAKAWRDGVKCEDYEPDMRLVLEAMKWNDIIKPKFFLMENVKGSARYFSNVHLFPIMIHGPFFFYGVFPYFSMPEGWRHIKETRKKGDGGMSAWSDDPLRKNKKGKVPLELSIQIKKVFECQKTLWDF